MKSESSIGIAEHTRPLKATILIVDDEPNNRFALAQVLSELEETVVEAESGEADPVRTGSISQHGGGRVRRRFFELDGRAVYELDYGYPEHDHLYCVKCHTLIELK